MTVVCPSCSTEIDDGSQTCPVCGGSLLGAAWVAPLAAKETGPSDTPSTDSGEDGDFIPLQYPEPAPRRRLALPTGRRGAILAAVAAVILALAVWGLIGLLGDGNDAADPQSASDVDAGAVLATPGTPIGIQQGGRAADVAASPTAIEVRKTASVDPAAPDVSPADASIGMGTATIDVASATRTSPAPATPATPGPASDATPSTPGSASDATPATPGPASAATSATLDSASDASPIVTEGREDAPGMTEVAGPLGDFVNDRAQEAASSPDAPEASPSSPAGDGTGGPLPNAGTPPPRGGV